MSRTRLRTVGRPRTSRAAACVAFAHLAIAPLAASQNTLDVLHSFGTLAQPAAPSRGRLLETSGGVLYGTTTAGSGAIYRLTPDGLGGYTLSVFHSFGGRDGRSPQAGLLDGGDGFLYGTTQNGGGSDAGTVYRIDASARLTTLHSFAGTDGSMPFSALLDGGDGFLYGTTYTYTSTIFKIARDGSSFVKLRTLGPSEGAEPIGTLVRGDDGFLYGTMSGGYGTGATDGTLFQIGTDGSDFAVLHWFATSPGSRPVGGLLKASDGMLYGVTSEGEDGGNGVIYRFDPALSDYTILHSLIGSEGRTPEAGLLEGSDGWLYGTTSAGGKYSGGTLFKVDRTNGTLTTLRAFAPADGTAPIAALIRGSDGYLYGTCSQSGSLGGGTVFRIAEDGSGFSVLAHLDASTIEGILPRTGLVRAGDYFYGTTEAGGATGSGTVFRVAVDGSQFATLHSFSLTVDGDGPIGPLLAYSDGLLYGVAFWGGPAGGGTLFRLGTDGSVFEVIRSFDDSSCLAGCRPLGGLVDGGDGFLYGVTSGDWHDGSSMVYRLNPATLAFESVAALQSGSEPQGSLLRKGSSFYGGTRQGGANYAGSVFRVDLPPGGSVTTLHSFETSGPNGRYANGGLVEGSDGLIYGTTTAGGTGDRGTIFRIGVDESSFSTVFSFSSFDGRSPDGPLVVGDSGFLYGTTRGGGEHVDAGAAYVFSPAAGVFSLLYSFDARDSQGDAPTGPLLQTSDGRLYGTTSRTGGDTSSTGGTVYRLSPPAHVLPASNVTICRDQKGPTLTATTAGPARTYQWGYRPLYGSVTALVGQTGPTYTVNGADFPDIYDGGVAEVVCTIRYAGDYGESTSNPVAVTVNAACGGGSAVPPPVRVFTAATSNGTASTTLHWVNPATDVNAIVIRYRSDGVYPTSADDAGSQLLCGMPDGPCGSAAAGAIGTFVHSSQTPGTTYSYGVFTRSAAASSGGKFASAVPFNGPPKASWAYSTGATSVVPPGLLPTASGTPGALYTVSNDRGLHAMTLGATGGDWPAGWKPLLMNAPSQGRPIPVNFPTFTVNGVRKVVYVTSQDGRVYVADALTGALLRSSAVLGDGIQHSPGAMLRNYGGAYDVLIVGTRNTVAALPMNELIGLDPDTLAVLWRFDNGKGTNGIGIISGQPLVDYATNRVYFTSRQLAGGSGSTVWCLSFTESGATKVWEANVGSVDASVTLSNGTLYVGNLDGNVYALNASDGTFKWTTPFVTGDGPVRSLVWSAGTGNRLYFSTTRKTWAITDNGAGTAPTAYWTPAPGVTSPSNPLVYSGRSYVGTGTGQLLEFDVTVPGPPAPVGVALTPHPAQIGRPTMDSVNGLIYVGTDEGTVHAASYPF